METKLIVVFMYSGLLYAIVSTYALTNAVYAHTYISYIYTHTHTYIYIYMNIYTKHDIFIYSDDVNYPFFQLTARLKLIYY